MIIYSLQLIFLNLSVIVNDIFKFWWSIFALNILVHFLIHAEQNAHSISRSTIETHENTWDTESKDTEANIWIEWLRDLGVIVGGLGDDNVSNNSGGNGNTDGSKKLEDHSESSSDSNSEWVSQNKEKTFLSSWTEWLAGHDGLDVGLLIEELDEFLEAVKTTLAARNHEFANSSWLLLGRLGHGINIFQNNSDNENKSSNEWSEGNGTNVELEQSKTLAGVVLDLSSLEIPVSDGSHNDEVSSIH